ncbi:DUF4344 domain-containing metallopeptidase [Streptomyces sp. NBC_00555]|uniref:DUF4344 domain-containing metallopeptidase n=1 Tax=Streptomyces sp. NBC_00555 TaxID=2903662 RepID=UPI00225A3B56|nr:DUF4344 domain-containing metallopeptidase [Streptomyces sp. NBC_00555]MCX5012074.1 DUF4344 domain-containing metallopeptidase [Streptomyces sp. NBC_00555]
MTARGIRTAGVAAVLAGCAAGALLVWPTTGFEEELPDKGFVLRYEEPAAADRQNSRFLQDRKIAESVLDDLNDYLALPYRVTVVARSCAGEGTGYDPQERRVELCYDDLTEERELFERAGDPRPDEPLAEVVRETLHHEAGHALVDALDLRPGGDRAEEDAADRFAQVMLLLRDPEGGRTLLTAARAYDLAAAADPAPDPTDEHAPPAARAESHRCAVRGAAPDRHPDLATPPRADCPATWARTRDTWTHDLSPLLRR